MPIAVRQRLAPAAGLILTVAAGLAVRVVTEGAVAKIGGVALYGTAIYVLVVLIRPRLPSLGAAGTAVAICWAVEFAQLTPFPAAASDRSTLARLALGSTFSPPDLGSYLAGILLGVMVRLVFRNREQGGT